MNKTINIESLQEAQALSGPQDEFIRVLEKEFKVKITLRGEHIKLSGSATNIKKASGLIEYILDAFRLGQEETGKQDLAYLIATFKNPKKAASLDMPESLNTRVSSGKQIGPKTTGQRDYVEAIKKHDLFNH